VSGRQGAETAFPDLPDVSRGLRPARVFRSDGFDTILPYRGIARKGTGKIEKYEDIFRPGRIGISAGMIRIWREGLDGTARG